MATQTHKTLDHDVTAGRLCAWIVGLTGFCLSLAAWSGLTVRSAATPIVSPTSHECGIQVALHVD